ncbi:anti-sigma factor [Algoriphagus sediminis]|uniref:Anti-sigma factor n=1 Tax=Algoriphagus sediminis TaxID=3057113 RepID=A0ABT7YA85_9BACT|nr:anti-sigma factor [Algoriphagus sediminis]MDN3203435.1 anti-sigma factor [Algoriphagus sediminis]
MDIKEYIASGILEAYWAGELSEEEMKEVDRIASIHPKVKAELDGIKEALESYGKSTRKDPNRNVLSAALSEIKEDEQSEFLKEVFNEEESPEETKSQIKTSKLPFWSVAASILLLISLAFNFYFFSKFQSSNEQLIALQNDLEVIRNQQSSLVDLAQEQKQELAYADLRIAHFLNKDNIHVRMDGLDISPESFANVFWNVKTNAVFISVDNLPEPPHGHQYQLWAIKAGQAPIDAGIFDHSLLVQELKVIKGDVQAFAVTLEKEGGSPVATVDQTYVKGFLGKS